MNIVTKFGIAYEEKLRIEPYGEGSYRLCCINLKETDDEDEYDLLGFDAPIDDDPVWRFWVECGDKDGCAETYGANITEEEKEYIKSLYYDYIKNKGNIHFI